MAAVAIFFMPMTKKKPTITLEQNKNKNRANRGYHGRLLKGTILNPTGRNGLLGIDELIDALNNEALRKKLPDFNTYVARRAFRNPQVLIAVMKKIYPDKIEHSGKITFTQEERNARLGSLREMLSLN